MNFLDSLAQIKSDLIENEEAKKLKEEQEKIAKKEEELRTSFIDFMKQDGVKQLED